MLACLLAAELRPSGMTAILQFSISRASGSGRLSHQYAPHCGANAAATLSLCHCRQLLQQAFHLSWASEPTHGAYHAYSPPSPWHAGWVPVPFDFHRRAFFFGTLAAASDDRRTGSWSREVDATGLEDIFFSLSRSWTLAGRRKTATAGPNADSSVRSTLTVS